MKTLFCLALAILFGWQLAAQKTIEKSFDLKNGYVAMEVPFADDIEVKTWDRPQVYFKAIIITEDGKYLDRYALNIEESKNGLSIASDSEPLLKALYEDGKANAKKSRYACDQYRFSYSLYVPKNVRFRISSINGSMRSENIEGDFTAELINGDIDIKQYRGKLELSTINGEIDLPVRGATLVAETIHGDIYADGALNLIAHDQHHGQKVEGGPKGAKSSLRLNTINGNMYLRL